MQFVDLKKNHPAMDCQEYSACDCVGMSLPCTVEEKPDPCKNYTQPLAIDTSLQYNSSMLGVTGPEGVGLLMILVTPGPDVADTQTISTTTIIPGSQKNIPSEENYDPYLASGFTQLKAVPHDLHQSQDQHEDYLYAEEDHNFRQSALTHNDVLHECHTSDAWSYSRISDHEHLYSENSSDSYDSKVLFPKKKNPNSGASYALNHPHQYHSGNAIERYSVYTSDTCDRYWECSNDSSDTTDSYWSQDAHQYNFPDYDILSRSYGNAAAGNKLVTRTVYDDYTDSMPSTSSSVGYTTSSHMVRLDQYGNMNTTEAKKSLGAVSRHCGQIAGRLITQDFFKSNIYAEEWIMNH